MERKTAEGMKGNQKNITATMMER